MTNRLPIVFNFPLSISLLMACVMLPLPVLFIIALVESSAFYHSHDPTMFDVGLTGTAFFIFFFFFTTFKKITITDSDVVSVTLFGKDIIPVKKIISCEVVSNTRGTSWLEIHVEYAVVDIGHSFLKKQLHEMAACINARKVS